MDIPPVVKELLKKCKAKGMHDSYLFRLADTDGNNAMTRKEFTKALTLAGLELQATEIKSIFEFFDSTSDGVIDFAEFTSVMGDPRALTQPRWNSSPPKRYRREEEKAAETKKLAAEACLPRGWGAVTNGPAPSEWSWSEEWPGQTKGRPPPADWTPRSDLGERHLENKAVPSRYPQSTNNTHQAGRWMDTLRATASDEVGISVPLRSNPRSLEEDHGKPQIIGALAPSDYHHVGPESGERQGGLAKYYTPPRPRTAGEPAYRTQGACLPKEPYVDEYHYYSKDALERATRIEEAAAEIYNPIPKSLGRIKSEAELQMERIASKAKASASREFKAYQSVSDLAAGTSNPIAYSGFNTSYAEWQRSHSIKPAAGGTKETMEATENMPEKVKEIVRAMQSKGFAECYFFRMIDADRSGYVTKREFEEGLALLKISLEKEELTALFDYFAGDAPSMGQKSKSGKISYHKLQKALNTGGEGRSEGGNRPTRWMGQQPVAPISGKPQFSYPGSSEADFLDSLSPATRLLPSRNSERSVVDRFGSPLMSSSS